MNLNAYFEAYQVIFPFLLEAFLREEQKV
ncbi:hypothetical protein H816_YJM1418G00442 [Saccharomyces cerevisiae YJM1418]|nr:hypothetical protein H816_YJM1418G00442 [Saccharomyces cerevisiae YJM1418]AJS02921.1 hypothetical protein H823_YJM1447G00438 [Saccharomyces cerevisiae YJM1447]